MASAVDKKIEPFFAYVESKDKLKRVKIIAVCRRQSRYGDGYYFISDKDEQYRNVIKHNSQNVKTYQKILNMNKRADQLQNDACELKDKIDREHASNIYFSLKQP